MKKNILVFGTGKYFEASKERIEKKYNIIGFIDNYKVGTYLGLKIFNIDEIHTLMYEKILICSMYSLEIIQQLIDEGIEKNAIEFTLDSDSNVLEVMREKNIDMYIDEDNNVIFKYKDIFLNLKNNTDKYVVKEVFLYGEYNYDFDLEKTYTVIDIGANIGDTSLYFANNNNVEKVIAFEPFKPTYERAKDNIYRNINLMNKIDLRNYGLGDKSEKIEVYYNSINTGNMSSVVNNEEFIDENKTKCELIIKSFEEVFSEIVTMNKQNSILLKIDCEGAEFSIFESVRHREDLFVNVEAIIMEWHHKYPVDILVTLKEFGFRTICKRTVAKVGMIYAFKR
ncbi:MAG: FkbM family methyltransferase [Sarcina sp.]